MNSGKIITVTAYTDTTVYDKGIKLLSVPAGKQGYFTQPSVISVTTTGSCHLTETEDSAKALLFKFMQEAIASDESLSESLGSLDAALEAYKQYVETTIVNGFISEINGYIVEIQNHTDATDVLVSTNASNIATNAANIATNISDISSNSSAITSLQSSITALQSSITALQSNVINPLPNWASAVSLSPSSTDYTYTLPSNGWICGCGYSSATSQCYIKINGVIVAYDDEYMASFQVLAAAGDVLTVTAWSNGHLYFVPCKS